MDRKLNRQEIEALMPHGDPFLFIDSAEIGIGLAKMKYKIRGDEFFFKGHFKNNPIFPATLMLEAVGQLGVLYLPKKNIFHILGQRKMLEILPPRRNARHRAQSLAHTPPALLI